MPSVAAESIPPSLEHVLNYRVILPDGYDSNKALMQFKQIEEEEPQLLSGDVPVENLPKE